MQKKKYNYVYVTTNIKNGKRYVGDHSTNNLNDGYLGSGRYFGNAVKKYGKKIFKRIILEQFETKQEAFDAQEKWINEFNTIRPHGYNLSPKGGLNVKGCHSAETLQKISDHHSHYWSGKKQSQELIDKRAKSNTGKKRTQKTKDKTRNSLLGIKHTEERKKNISNSLKGNSSLAKNFGDTSREKNGMYKKISNDELIQIIELHQSGLSPRKIAFNLNNKFGWAKILKTLRENNVYMRSKYANKL